MSINIKQGDCLDLMKDIPDGSVDMILADLPYGTTKNKWDSIINVEELINQYTRVIKDHGAIVLFGSNPFSSYLIYNFGKRYKHQWIWNKKKFSNQMSAKHQPLKIQEDVIVFSKNGEKVNYYPQGLIEINKVTRQGRKITENIGGGERPKEYIQTHTNYPRNIIEFSLDKEKIHPTQKPVPLLEYLIKTYTNEGETVLDNTMGSGSTGIACQNTNRNFIGFELDETYFNIAKERLENNMEQLNG